jgi:hypothetical protein
MKIFSVVVAFLVVTSATFASNARFASNQLASNQFAGNPALAWERSYDSGNEDWANGVAIDPDGHILVSGGSIVGTDDDIFRLIKYDPDGNELWHKTHNPGMNDWPLGLAIDWQGNSYTGGGYNQDFYALKLDKNGNIVWEKTFDGGGDEWAYAVVCDPWGNVYISGVGFITFKFDPLGNVLMSDAHPSLSGCAYDAAVAPDGSVYIGGYSGSDDNARVIKYDSYGNLVWNKPYGSDTTNDFVNGIAVDDQGYVYFTGISYVPPSGPDYINTCKLDPDGNIIWQKVFDSGNNDDGTDIAVDKHFVYVVGTKDNGTDNDLIVLRYDRDGNPGWEITKNWGGDDEFYSIASDNAGSFYVAGETELDERVVKFLQDDFPVAAAEGPASKPALMLEARSVNRSQVAIRYVLPSEAAGTLAIYALDGRQVKFFNLTPHSSLLTTTTISVDTRAFPAGTYFARLESGGQSLTRKVVIIK